MITVTELPDSYEELEELINSGGIYVPEIFGEITKYYNNYKFENICLLIENLDQKGFTNVLTKIFFNEWMDFIEYFYFSRDFTEFHPFEKAFNNAFKLNKISVANFFVTLLNLKKIVISQYSIEKLFKSAIISREMEIVYILFCYINPNNPIDKYLNTPLMYAIKNQCFMCANFLLDYSNIFITNDCNYSAFKLISDFNDVFDQDEYFNNIYFKLIDRNS